MQIGAEIRHVNSYAAAVILQRRMRFIDAMAWLCLGLVFTACSSSQPARQGAAVPRTVNLTRVVRIPATNEVEKLNAGQADIAKPAVSLGNADELPEGPDGFDVTSDGSFLITDPLRKRIAVFDRNGKFLSDWQIGFAADSVAVKSENLVQVREAKTGELRLFDLQGRPALGTAESAEPGDARLTSSSAGAVAWTSALDGRGSLQIEFNRPGMRLLSLQAVAKEPSGDGYVALESTAGGDAVQLNKSVRRYSRDGKLTAETTDLPLDYFVRPTDEIRVRNGVVYQLMTTMAEVNINVWDTN